MTTFKFTNRVSHFRGKLVNAMAANGYEQVLAENTLSGSKALAATASLKAMPPPSPDRLCVQCHHVDMFFVSVRRGPRGYSGSVDRLSRSGSSL